MATLTNLTLLLILLLVTLFQLSTSILAGNSGPIHVDGGGASRNLLALRRKVNQAPNCGEIATRSQCSAKAECRWCRSEAVDDACFSKLEAWRLPSQVFSCD
ncbi:hypothetical protein RJ639_019619 [Escallonia herrerae]|uniref:Uncharacterized protein n=1 Tax=Escallonia herrerae TaxID=1293975 RepID=A0AA88VB44_9ASTE|nr:hypothetical protein RJ639_019619 [Escallonia herrerae]